MIDHPQAASYAWIWAPYSKYAGIDWVYGLGGFEAFLRGEDGFGYAQTLQNVVEIFLCLYVVSIATTKPSQATMLAFLTCAFTFWKTVTYFLNDAVTDFAKSTKDTFDFWLLYIIPNGVWIVVPLLALIATGKAIVNGLDNSSASSSTAGAKKQKKQH